MSRPVKLIIVAGARPNFMKIASFMGPLQQAEHEFSTYFVHTGQHYGKSMSEVFFEDLGIPAPDLNMDVRSGTHAKQTAAIMTKFEEVVLQQRPDAVIVVGDVNSTVACALVAAKIGVSVIHVEAGLRSFDRRMPEEINRILTDAISDLLFVSEPSGVENLRREGVDGDRVHLVGNVMIDTLIRQADKAKDSIILQQAGLESKSYALLTLHRPANVDDARTFLNILGALKWVAERLPVVFPVHPRTLDRLTVNGLRNQLDDIVGLRLLPPLGYIDFLKLESAARMVLTDSGGVQEETTFLGVPCLTIRENTERPITITNGTNTLAGTSAQSIVANADRVLRGEVDVPDSPPDLWDGHAGERVVAILREKLTT